MPDAGVCEEAREKWRKREGFYGPWSVRFRQKGKVAGALLDSLFMGRSAHRVPGTYWPACRLYRENLDQEALIGQIRETFSWVWQERNVIAYSDTGAKRLGSVLRAALGNHNTAASERRETRGQETGWLQHPVRRESVLGFCYHPEEAERKKSGRWINRPLTLWFLRLREVHFLKNSLIHFLEKA